jgi:hypothetical protein
VSLRRFKMVVLRQPISLQDMKRECSWFAGVSLVEIETSQQFWRSDGDGGVRSSGGSLVVVVVLRGVMTVSLLYDSAVKRNFGSGSLDSARRTGGSCLRFCYIRQATFLCESRFISYHIKCTVSTAQRSTKLLR